MLVQRGRLTTTTAWNIVAAIHVCEACGHVFFHPPPTSQQLTDYYNGRWNAGTGFSIDDSYEAWFDKLDEYTPHRTFVDSVLRLRQEHFSGRQQVIVHDASCGYGALVERLNQLGFEATGSDIDADAIRIARSRGNLNVYQRRLENVADLIPAGADIITCYHAAEHYIDPVAFFREVASRLRDGGFFLMAVPNGAFLPARVDFFGNFDWCIYPGHLQYFTPQSARVLLGLAGLQVIDTSSCPWEWPQQEWLLSTTTGLCANALPDPESLIKALAANGLTRDLRVLAVKNSHAVNLRAPGCSYLWPATNERVRADSPTSLERGHDSSDSENGPAWPMGVLRTLKLVSSPRRFMVSAKNLGLWLKVRRDPAALEVWNAYFDRTFYWRAYPDVRMSGVDPALHFLLCGADEGRNPSLRFNTLAYQSTNGDVAASRMNPLLHFALYGRREARPVHVI